MFIGIGISLVGQLPHSAGGAPADTTAPVLSSPIGTQTSPTTATVGATTDEGNGVIWWVVTTSSTAPTAQQIIDGQNHLGAAAVAADFITVGSTGAKTDTATGLSASTAYYVHLVHEDVAGNRSNIVSSAQFTTAAAPDVTAPTLSSPTGTQTGSTTADLGVTSDEANGTLYVAVLPSASAAPTGAAFIAGTTGGVYTASDTTPTAGVNSFSATGLTASTGYKAHYFHEDSAGNDSNVASSATFTTTAVIAPVLTQTSAAGENPMSWSSFYEDVIIGTDYITMRWRVDGGSWTDETDVLFDSDFYFDYGVDAASYPWPLFAAAAPFAGGALIEVQEGIKRAGSTTWSSTLSDTMAAPAWTPDSLWLASENGDWFSASDLSKMFQDTAGTTPVTAAGQTIKRLVGQRGNIVLTDTTGITLQNDGTENYFSGSGTTKLASTTTVSITNGSGELTAFGAGRFNSASASREMFSADDGSTSSRIGGLIRTSLGAINTGHFNTAGTSITDSGATITVNTRFTARAKHKTTTLETWLNGSSNGTTAVTGTLRSAAHTLYMFERAATKTEGRIYKGFGVIGRATTTLEDAEIDTWLA